MPGVQVENDAIYYARWGSGTRRLFLAVHGSGGNYSHWPGSLGGMEDAAVLAVDLPGHGRSGGKSCRSVADYAAFIRRFADALQIDQVILMGHSLGGAIVQTVALDPPRWLQGIVLVGTGARLRVSDAILNALRTDPEAAIKTVIEFAVGPEGSMDLTERLRTGFLSTPIDVILGDYLACNGFDAMETVGGIRVPTLVVSGEADRLTPVKYGDYLAGRIPGARHVVIPRAGHMMALEFPEPFARAVALFDPPRHGDAGF